MNLNKVKQIAKRRDILVENTIYDSKQDAGWDCKFSTLFLYFIFSTLFKLSAGHGFFKKIRTHAVLSPPDGGFILIGLF
jgi:hypothetical protein